MTRSDVRLRDRFEGCLLGCAVGDALGAPYEGLWAHSIPDADSLLSGFAEFEVTANGAPSPWAAWALRSTAAVAACPGPGAGRKPWFGTSAALAVPGGLRGARS